MRLTIVALLLTTTTGCLPRYSGKPALEFGLLPYRSLAGKPWPAKRLALRRTKVRYKLAKAPILRYVELNPGGRGPVLFVHGLGSYLKFWRYQLDRFAKRGYRVLAVDLPGFGKSDKPARFPYTTESFADVLVEVMDALEIPRAIVVGHSMGGQAALSLGIRHPARVRALVLTSPAGFETFSRREQRWFKMVFSTALVKGTSEYGIWGSVRLNNFRRWRPELRWLIEERVRLARSKDFDAYAYAQVRAVEGLAKNDFVRTNAGKVKAPTLIIFGEDDRLIPNPYMHGGRPRSVFTVGHQAIRGSRLVGLERCGHTVQMDCPAEYNAAVFEFLKGIRKARK